MAGGAEPVFSRSPGAVLVYALLSALLGVRKQIRTRRSGRADGNPDRNRRRAAAPTSAAASARRRAAPEQPTRRKARVRRAAARQRREGRKRSSRQGLAGAARAADGQTSGSGRRDGKGDRAPDARVEDPAKETPADPAKDKTIAEAAPNGDVKQQAPQPPPTHRGARSPAAKTPRRPALEFPRSNHVPDVAFGGAALPAPVAGGNAKARYLTIVYGMIMARVHKSTSPRPKSKGEGEVSFVIDGRGYLRKDGPRIPAARRNSMPRFLKRSARRRRFRRPRAAGRPD